MNEDRLRELSGKEVLTTDELIELHKLAGRELVELPSLDQYVQSPERAQAVENSTNLNARIVFAKEAGCFIEVLALQFQHMELALHMYWKHCDAASHSTVSRPTFGICIAHCKRLGLPDETCRDLFALNKKRNDLIHGFAYGKIAYEALEPLCKKANGIQIKLWLLVSEFVGVPPSATKFYEPGSLMFSPPKTS